MPLEAALVRKKVEQITNVATVPQVVVKVSALLDSQAVSAGEVAEELSKDQVLAAKVLKLVNSGFCGFRKPISTITHAMVLLGFDVVRSLVVSASVFDLFSEMSNQIGGLWEHSLAVAKASTAIAQRMAVPKPEEYAVAGLLHDIGKVVIAQQFPAQAADVRALIEQSDCLGFEAEKDVLGVTHAEIGMWLLKKWSLPAKLVNPVAYHNNFHPSREYADRTAVVHVADILVRAKGIGYPGDRRMPSLDRQAWDMVHLTMPEAADVLVQVEGEMADEVF